MPDRKVLLVGWGGADWKLARRLVQSGQMPQLAHALKKGASGPVESSPPFVSPMLWSSIATGMHPHRHGILGYTQVDSASGCVEPVTSDCRQCPAFWNILTEQGLRTHLVNWFTSYPAETIDGVCVSEAFARPPRRSARDWSIPPESVSPADWTKRMEKTRVAPEDVDRGLLRLFLPHLDEMDLGRDRRWEKLLYRLAELYTAHNAAVTLLDADTSWRCLAVYDHFIHWVSGEFAAYRPGADPEVSEREVRLYGSVVDAAYRVQDVLLADLLNHAGPDVTLVLVSDPEARTRSRCPGQGRQVVSNIADSRRPHGLLVVTGPGIRAGYTLEGAHILDVTPTLLHLFGLPVGKDMDGRALFEITVDSKTPERIASWSDKLRKWQRGAPDESIRRRAPDAVAAWLRRLIDSRYVTPPSDSLSDFVEATQRENVFNRGIALLEAGLPAQAVPHLWSAHAGMPEAPHYAFHLARALAASGLRSEANEALEVLRDFGETHTVARQLQGQIALLLTDFDAASRHFEAAGGGDPEDVLLQKQRGLLALYANRCGDAESCFRKALAHDAEDALAWLGLARAFLGLERYTEASDAAERALALDPALPLAHLTRAQAFDVLGDAEAAAESHAEALRLEPNLKNSRDALFRLHPAASAQTQETVLRHLARSRMNSPAPPIPPHELRGTLEQLHRERARKLAERRSHQEPVYFYK